MPLSYRRKLKLTRHNALEGGVSSQSRSHSRPQSHSRSQSTIYGYIGLNVSDKNMFTASGEFRRKLCRWFRTRVGYRFSRSIRDVLKYCPPTPGTVYAEIEAQDCVVERGRNRDLKNVTTHMRVFRLLHGAYNGVHFYNGYVHHSNDPAYNGKYFNMGLRYYPSANDGCAVTLIVVAAICYICLLYVCLLCLM